MFGNCQKLQSNNPLTKCPRCRPTQGIGRDENTVGMCPMFYLIDNLERMAIPQASLAKPIFDILKRLLRGCDQGLRFENVVRIYLAFYQRNTFAKEGACATPLIGSRRFYRWNAAAFF